MKAPASKADATDGEHLRQTVETHGYEMLRADYAEMINQETRKLLSTTTERNTALAQGAIAALMRVMDAPKRIADKIAAREAKKA